MPGGRWRDWIGGLWSGFVTPSPLAVRLTLVVLAATAVLLCLVLTPGLIAGPMGVYMARSIYDNEPFATHFAVQLATSSPDKDQGAGSLYMISDSVLAHAFASDTETAKALERATGRPWRATFLTTPSQGPFDEATLADQASRHGPGVVVLPATFERFEDSRSELMRYYHMERLGVRSDWADQEVASLGEKPRWRTGVFAIDNSHFIVTHVGVMLVRAALHKPVVRRIDNFLPRRPWDADQLAAQRRVILARLRHGVDPDGLGVRLLADLVRRLDARGITVILAEQPVSAELFEGPKDQALYKAYLDQSAALTGRLGAVYCHLTGGDDPPPKDFADYVHVINPAVQDRMRRALAGCVAAALKSKGTS